MVGQKSLLHFLINSFSHFICTFSHLHIFTFPRSVYGKMESSLFLYKN